MALHNDYSEEKHRSDIRYRQPCVQSAAPIGEYYQEEVEVVFVAKLSAEGG